ncbi:hypothetical protein J5N97_028702 [Dioscorea zingiberensis]|uniref:Thaumatin-like protein n=1 Tax=Dioscorea zingiberensis TaxID=325984 RepID=A0A9D5BZM6_9LILI|nr:hypothetical protein J5N97_028702 [Dioscorea zingiberensis]
MKLMKLIIFMLLLQGAVGATLEIENSCNYNIWPAISNNPSSPLVPKDLTGFLLPPNASKTIPIPSGWSGRLWARTLCAPAGRFHRLNCTTGDCNTGALQCGSLPHPPITLIDINSASSAALNDSYELTLVAGFNVPVSVIPPRDSGCRVASCTADVNAACPPELRLVANEGGGGDQVIACMSACQALNDDVECCSGEYRGVDKCKPTKYNDFFKGLCPSAMTHFLDNCSTFGCASGSDYVIRFCGGV